MRGHVRALLGSCAFFSLIAACGLDDSVIDAFSGGDASDDGTLVDAQGDSSPSDSGGDSTLTDAGHDAGEDAGIDATVDSGFDSGTDSGVDSGFDAGPCSALTLCDSDASACGASQVCVPEIPAGWTLLGFDAPPATSLAACGTGYTAHSAIDVTDGGTASCDCSCNGTNAPSCTNVQVVLTTDNGCTADSTTTSVTSACQALGSDFTVVNSSLNAHLQADPTTCVAQLDASIPSWSLGSARTCDFSGDAGATFCSGHATCVEANGAAHKTCIKKAYSGSLPPACAASCPTGFQSSCFAAASTLSDGRTCTSCACAWSDTGCTAASVTGSDQSDCSGDATHNQTIAAESCTTAFTISPLKAVAVTGTADTPTCDQTTAASSSGSVSTTGEDIVCCAN
jgi:hypothetical protein